MGGRSSRAAFLRTTAAGGAVIAAGSSAAALLNAPRARAGVPDADLTALRLLTATELLTADFAARALAAGRLTKRAAALVRQVRADDRAHYAGLARLTAAAGQTPTTADDIDFAYPAGSFASEASILALAWRLETTAAGAYLGALAQLQAPELRLPLAQIAANEAQHVSAFAALVGRPVIGRAFAPALSTETVSATLDRYES